MEENNKVLFVDDVIVIRNTNQTINTTVYQKPTNTDIYINWHSHSSLQWKKTTANVLIQRAIEICSKNKFLDEELDIIKHNLCAVNNYPRKFMQNIINGASTDMRYFARGKFLRSYAHKKNFSLI